MKEFINETTSFLKNKLWFTLFRGRKIQRNKIVVTNYFGKGNGDSPKYIVNELLKENEKLDIVWLVKNIDEEYNFPLGVRAVKYNTVQGIYELSTAKIWIDNCRKMNGELKKKGQYYIQTWHGMGPKKCEKDVESNLSKSYVYNAKRDSQMADLFVSPARFMTDLYHSAFWYSGEVLEVGYPRNDIFLYDNKHEIRNAILSHYGISKEKKVLMYAPTFRNNHDINCYNIDFKLCIKKLEERFGGKWIVMMRLHPNLTELNKNIEFDSESFFDVSDYPDAQELLVCADAFISDYSSILIDFFNTKNPSFVYAPDIESYKKERNFYFDLNTLPAEVCKNNEELMEKISKYDEKRYLTKMNEFEKKMGICECGMASKKVVEYIMKQIGDDR